MRAVRVCRRQEAGYTRRDVIMRPQESGAGEDGKSTRLTLKIKKERREEDDEDRGTSK